MPVTMNEFIEEKIIERDAVLSEIESVYKSVKESRELEDELNEITETIHILKQGGEEAWNLLSDRNRGKI